MGEGNTVKLMPIHAELTTQEGTDLLNISRPTFVKMLGDGVIGYNKAGNRRKVRYADVQDYKQQLELNRLEALSKLSALDQTVGAGY